MNYRILRVTPEVLNVTTQATTATPVATTAAAGSGFSITGLAITACINRDTRTTQSTDNSLLVRLSLFVTVQLTETLKCKKSNIPNKFQFSNFVIHR